MTLVDRFRAHLPVATGFVMFPMKPVKIVVRTVAVAVGMTIVVQRPERTDVLVKTTVVISSPFVAMGSVVLNPPQNSLMERM